MQSIKNTTVGIMLLFLSYGVYQVMMKPVPQRQDQQPLDMLSITDPDQAVDLEGGLPEIELPPPSSISPDGPSDQFAATNSLDFAADQVEDSFADSSGNSFSSQPIPPDLLTPPPAADSTATGNDFAAASNTDSKIASPEQTKLQPAADQTSGGSDNSFYRQGMASSDFEGETELDGMSDQFAGSSSNDEFQSKLQPETEAPPQEEPEIMMTSAMSDVSPRPGSQFQPAEFAAATDDMESAGGNAAIADAEVEAKPQERSLSQAWPEINAMVESGRFQPALVELTRFYRSNSIDAAERKNLLDWLDALAAKVIYSNEHHLRSTPYVIQPGDTIASLARRWRVPAQLIYNINVDRIPDPNELTSGTEIKLIEGPFDAEIDSTTETMTLFLGEMYAGRFAIRASSDLSAGQFSIVDKSANDQVDRPWWISLSSGAAIFGSDDDPASSKSIALDAGEAEEVFSILSAASTVRVMR